MLIIALIIKKLKPSCDLPYISKKTWWKYRKEKGTGKCWLSSSLGYCTEHTTSTSALSHYYYYGGLSCHLAGTQGTTSSGEELKRQHKSKTRKRVLEYIFFKSKYKYFRFSNKTASEWRVVSTQKSSASNSLKRIEHFHEFIMHCVWKYFSSTFKSLMFAHFF